MTRKQKEIASIKEGLGSRHRMALEALAIVVRNEILELLSGNNKAEKERRGFTRQDNHVLGSFVSYLFRKGSLTDKQMKLLFTIMPKYADQYRDAVDAEMRDDWFSDNEVETTPYEDIGLEDE